MAKPEKEKINLSVKLIMVESKDDYGISKESINQSLKQTFCRNSNSNLRAEYLQVGALLLRPEKEQIYQNLSLSSVSMTAR